jgi:hypothetical protein
VLDALYASARRRLLKKKEENEMDPYSKQHNYTMGLVQLFFVSNA